MRAGNTLKARLVRVRLEEGRTGLFYATSPDLKGLLVAEPTLDAVEEAVPSAITDLYAACGEEVVVTRLDEDRDQLHSWIAFPAQLAREALASRTPSDG